MALGSQRGSTRGKFVVTIAGLLGLALVATAPSAAAVGEFGTQVRTTDADEGNTLDGWPFLGICFVDDDGDGAYTPGEAVYAKLDPCGTDLQANDLRLTASAGLSAGTLVRATDADFGNPTSFQDFGWSVAVYDADGNGAYGFGDGVYVDMDGGFDAVAVGDVRLTLSGSFPAGTMVAAGNADVNNALADPALLANAPALGVGSWGFVDASADGAWGPGDAAYIDAGADGEVSAADIRVSSASSSSGGAASVEQLQAQVGELSHQLNETLELNANLYAQLSDANQQLTQATLQRHQLAGQLNATLAQSADLQRQVFEQSAYIAQLTEQLLQAGNTTPLPPVAIIEPVPGAECFNGGGRVLLDGSNSYSPTDRSLRFRWGAQGGFIEDVNLPRVRGNFTVGMSLVTLQVESAGLFDSATAWVLVEDSFPPSTQLRLDGEETTFKLARGPVVADFLASDACKMGTTYYRVDAGPWRAGDQAVVFGDGHHQLEFYSVDAEGNVEPSQSAFILIDGTPPTADAFVSGERGARGWWRSPVVVTIEGSNDTSGVVAIGVALDDEPLAFPASNDTGFWYHESSRTVFLDRTHTVRFAAMDRLGNVGPEQVLEVRIDAEPPALAIALDGRPGEAGWWRSAVTATARAADDGSGLARVEVAVDGGNFTAADSVVLRGPGAHAVTFRATDVAGHATFATTSFSIDATAPAAQFLEPQPGMLYVAGSHAVNPAGSTVVVGSLEVRGAGGDAGSGLARLVFLVDGVERGAALAPGVFGWDAGNESAGVHVLTIRAIDQAGNVGEAQLEVVTVPTAVEGVLATAEGCERVLQPEVCRAVEQAQGGTGEACAVVFSAFVCGLAPDLGDACLQVLAPPACALLGGFDAAPPAVGAPGPARTEGPAAPARPGASG